MSETLQMALNRIKPPSEEWRNGPKITAEDLKNNTGNVEYISSIHDDVPVVNNKKQTTLNPKILISNYINYKLKKLIL